MDNSEETSPCSIQVLKEVQYLKNEKKKMLQYVISLSILCLDDLVLSLQIMEVIPNTKCSSKVIINLTFMHVLSYANVL